MVYIDHDSLIDSSRGSSERSQDTYSLRSRNVSPAMKRATICVIVVITLVFLLLNIYGLMEIWKFYKEAKKRPPSLETIVKQQQEEATKRAEERMKEMEDGILKHFDTTTHLPPKWTTTYPTITRQYPTPDWATHSRTRSRISSYVFPVTTSSTTKIVPSTTVATRTIAASTTTTTELPTTTSHTTRIIVTRPPPTIESSTVSRIVVTRPHGHRHHGHHHHHHTTTTMLETVPTTTTQVTTTSKKLLPSIPKATPTTSKSETPYEEVTIVTALLDIGRGDWWEYRRPLEVYHQYMENLLSLKNNMVIFTDRNSYDFIHKYRKNMGLMHKTRIYSITLDDLPLSRHLPYAQKIIEDELKNDTFYRWDQSIRSHPEAKSAEYDVLVCSKSYFLYNATLDDPFNTDLFAWIDAGYGHGNANIYPFDNIWKPVFPKGKVSIIKLTPEHDLITGYKIDDLYRKNWSVVSGGFIGGDKRSLGQLHTIVHNKFIYLIYQNKVDDDQTLMVLAINSYPHLFSIRHGNWFDAFQFYSIDAETNFG